MVEKSRWARSSSVPPHLSPSAIKADLSRSRPSEASSSQEEKADRSRWAPPCVSAPPVSFGQPGNEPVVQRRADVWEGAGEG